MNETMTASAPSAMDELAAALCEFADQVANAFRQLVERIAEAIAPILKQLGKWIEKIYDAMLNAAADNPRHWHLYKHAKKARTRKKYRRRLERALLAKLRDLP